MHPRAVARELAAAVRSFARFPGHVVGPFVALAVLACAQGGSTRQPPVAPAWSSPFSARWRVVLERAPEGFVAVLWNDSPHPQAIGSAVDWELSAYSGAELLSRSLKMSTEGECLEGTLAEQFVAPGQSHRIPIECCAGARVTRAEFKLWFSQKHGTVCSEETVLVIHPRFDGAAP